MARSFHNKILRVNLTTGTIAVEEPGLLYMRKYMGGWNVIADVLLREVPQGADPLGPDNRWSLPRACSPGWRALVSRAARWGPSRR